MKVKEYLTEVTLYDALTNIVAVVRKKTDWNFANDVVNKAYGQKLISQKQLSRLQRELDSISKDL